MAPRLIIDIIIYGLSAVLSMALPIALRIKGRTTPLVLSLFALLSLIILGLLHPMIIYPNGTMAWYYVYIEYMSACFIGINWVVFAFFYKVGLRHKSRLAPLLLFPAVSYLYMIYNDFSCRMDVEKLATNIPTVRSWHTMSNFYINGMPLWLHYAILIGAFLIGAVIILKGFYRQRGPVKTIFFTATTAIPFVVNMIPVVAPGLLHRIMPVGLTVSSWNFSLWYVGYGLALLTLTVVAFRYCVFNVVPIALRELVDNMSAMVILADPANKILDFNRALVGAFCSNCSLHPNGSMRGLIDAIAGQSDRSTDSLQSVEALSDPDMTQYQGKLGIVQPETRFYTLTIQPIQYGQEVFGRIITFTDVTTYNNLVEELHQKNTALSSLNEDLKEHAATVAELAVLKERNRFARDIHDTLGQTLTLLIKLLEVGKVDLRTHPESVGENLDKSIAVARAGLQELYRSIEGLAPEKMESRSLIATLQNIFADFRSSGLTVEFNVDGEEKPCSPPVMEAVFRICQEALTNSIRHGRAGQSTVLLRVDPVNLKLFVFDDGVGCRTLIKGQGLSGMEQRVKELGGTFVCGSDGERGFNIRVQLPLNAP